MPPVDRRNPIRARSSESSLSFMEFMREFPDDETCLRHVWRERFSPDGERIKRQNKRFGRGGRRHCRECPKVS